MDDRAPCSGMSSQRGLTARTVGLRGGGIRGNGSAAAPAHCAETPVKSLCESCGVPANKTRRLTRSRLELAANRRKVRMKPAASRGTRREAWSPQRGSSSRDQLARGGRFWPWSAASPQAVRSRPSRTWMLPVWRVLQNSVVQRFVHSSLRACQILPRGIRHGRFKRFNVKVPLRTGGGG
jgi:hypothetical protein